jgi:hypothetical protein
MLARWHYMNAVETYLLLIGFAIIATTLVIFSFSRGRSLLNRWAQENNFQILDFEMRTLSAGPFTWTSSRNQIVYFVHVRDREGKERSGWVRCGSFWGGILSDKTEVRWKDES